MNLAIRCALIVLCGLVMLIGTALAAVSFNGELKAVGMGPIYHIVVDDTITGEEITLRVDQATALDLEDDIGKEVGGEDHNENGDLRDAPDHVSVTGP